MLQRNSKLTNELLPDMDGDIEDIDEDTNNVVTNTHADFNLLQIAVMLQEQGGTSSHPPGKVSRYGRPIIPSPRYTYVHIVTCLTFSWCKYIYIYIYIYIRIILSTYICMYVHIVDIINSYVDVNL